MVHAIVSDSEHPPRALPLNIRYSHSVLCCDRRVSTATPLHISYSTTWLYLCVGEAVGVSVLLSDVPHHGRHVEQTRDAHLSENNNMHSERGRMDAVQCITTSYHWGTVLLCVIFARNIHIIKRAKQKTNKNRHKHTHTLQNSFVRIFAQTSKS